MSITHVFSLLGGLALFLYGMDLMGKSLERQAGSRLQKILSRLTENPFKGFLLGLAVTAVIQSSSATTVMVVGFVNSGIMELHQAIGIIMGSNVGTTVTSWILSLTGLEGDSLLIQLLKPSTFSPLLAFIGVLLYLFGGEKKKGVGGILIGFAILMTGMTAMSDAVSPLENEKDKELGISDPKRDIVEKDNVYVISLANVNLRYMDRYYTSLYGEDYLGRELVDTLDYGERVFEVYDFGVKE